MNLGSLVLIRQGMFLVVKEKDQNKTKKEGKKKRKRKKEERKTPPHKTPVMWLLLLFEMKKNHNPTVVCLSSRAEDAEVEEIILSINPASMSCSAGSRERKERCNFKHTLICSYYITKVHFFIMLSFR